MNTCSELDFEPQCLDIDFDMRTYVGPKGDTGAQGPKGDTGAQGPKGETGATGETGPAAGFGSVTASVDSNIGTPSVTVTTSGENTAKNFDFAFHNLKGESGEPLEATASGSIISTSAAYAGAQLHGLKVYGASTQDGTPTPDSPVEIDSVSSASLEVRGKNLVDCYYDNSTNSSSYSFHNDQSIQLLAGVTYTAVPIGKKTEGNANLLIDGAASDFHWGWYAASAKSFTPSENCTITRASLDIAANSIGYFMLMVGDTVETDYTPYISGSTTPLDLGGNVLRGMGGVYDSATWTANGTTKTANFGSYTFTGSESTSLDDWRHFDGYYAAGFPLSLMPDRKAYSGSTVPNAMFEGVEAAGYSSIYSGTVGFALSTGNVDPTYSFFIRVPDTVASTTAELLAWLAGKTLVYQLATPTTTTLPAITLPTAPSSDMTAWLDSSPSTTIEVTYRESLQLVIDEIRNAIS